MLSPTWTFFNWTDAEGLIGEPIGKVTLDDLRFVEPAEGVFDKPDSAVEVEVPAAM